MTVSAYFLILLLFHLVFISIIIYNFFTAPRIFNTPKTTIENEGISILIPVRNEEKNIGLLLRSLSIQNYRNYEIIVLDDNSTDDSAKIVQEWKNKNSNISLIKGTELPEGWLGKNWACYQLSKIAKFKILLFIDADVRLKKSAINYSYWLMERKDLDMLSVFPSQLTSSFGEKLIVPLMNWLLLTFLPLNMVFKSGRKSFSAANGQFIMIRKTAYDEIGTHKKFKANVVEDMEIIRRIKEKKMRGMTCVGNNTILAAMYNSFSESFMGFSKNFFHGFNIKRFNFFLLITLLTFLFFFPFVLTAWNSVYFIIIIIIIFQRVLISLISKENIFYNIILHPFQILLMFIIGLSSLSKKKKLWKGRLI